MGGCPRFSKVKIMPTQITPSNLFCYVSLNQCFTEKKKTAETALLESRFQKLALLKSRFPQKGWK